MPVPNEPTEETQAVEPVEPTEPTPEVAPAEPEAETTEERTYTAEEYRRVTREAQALRRRLREAETAAATLTPELDGLRQERELLLSEARGYRLRDAIAAAQREHEALRGVDAVLAARLIEGVAWNEQGKPTGVKAALEALLTTYPQLAPTPRMPTQSAAGAGSVASVPGTDSLLSEKQKSGVYGRL